MCLQSRKKLLKRGTSVGKIAARREEGGTLLLTAEERRGKASQGGQNIKEFSCEGKKEKKRLMFEVYGQPEKGMGATTMQ